MYCTFQLDFEYKTALERDASAQTIVLKYLSIYSCYSFNLGLIGGYDSLETSMISYDRILFSHIFIYYYLVII